MATIKEFECGLMTGKGNTIIRNSPDTLVLVEDKETGGFTVSTRKYATDRQLKLYDLKK